MIKKRLWHAAISAGLALLLVICSFSSKVHENLESYSWSLKCKHLSEPSEFSDDIVVIMIDQNSLDWGNENGFSWPWPREMYKPIIEFCAKSKAKSLGIDLIFSGASVQGVEDDQVFSQSVKAYPHVAVTVFPHFEEKSNKSLWPSHYPSNKINLPESFKVVEAKSLTLPIEELGSVAKILGHVSNSPDEDNITRRVTAFYQFEDKKLPLLGLATYLAGEEDYSNTSFDHVPVDNEGRVLLNFRGKSFPYKMIAAHQVITTNEGLNDDHPSKNLSLDVLKGKYVFLGSNAVSLKDSVAISTQGHAASGVLLHALALDNFLAQDFKQEMSSSSVLLISTALILLVALMISFSVGLKSSVLVSLFSLILPVVVGILCFNNHYWFPDTLCLLAVLCTLILGQTFNFVREGNQRRFLKKHFEQRLSPSLVKELLKNPNAFERGGQDRELTIFFSDIQGFTGISENMEVSKLSELLNQYLTELTDIIIEEGGYLDKYIGDAIVAFWDAPIPQEDHASMACRAAIRCQEHLAKLQSKFKKEYGFELITRMGMNTGMVRVGFFGSAQRSEYTFLGDTGNLAARLEGANKAFGSLVMLSEDCLKKVNLPQQKFREIGLIKVVGRSQPVKVFEPILFDNLSDDDHKIYKKALLDVRQSDWPAAIAGFEQLPYDYLSQKYLSRCRIHQMEKEQTWDGIWNLNEK